MARNGVRAWAVAVLCLFVAAFGAQVSRETALAMPSAAGASGGEYDRDAPDVLEKIGAWSYGQALAVTIDEDRDLVYLGSGGAVLTLDVSDLSSPELVSDALQTGGLVVDIAYDSISRRLFLACGLGGLEIWDMNDPTSPELLFSDAISSYGFDLPVYGVELKDKLAILHCSWGYIRVFDVADPREPVHVGGGAETGNPTKDIYLDETGQLHASGAQAYVRYIVDPSGTLYANAFYDQVTGGFHLIAGSGSPSVAFGHIRHYLYLLDPESPYFPVFSVVEVGANLNDIQVQGNHLYFIRGYERELVIFDVADVYSPYQVGQLTLRNGPWKLEVSGDYAYLAVGYGGLSIVDISDPLAPVEVGAYETLSRSATVTVRGEHAYVAEHDDGVLVIDIADLSDPILAGQYDTPGWTHDVSIEGGLLYIADWDGGLRIAELSDPVNPVLVGVADVAQAWRLTVSGDHAYVVDEATNEPDWIRVIDVSDPALPTEVGSRLMEGDINGLDVTGDYLYAACREAGLRVLDVSTPSDPIAAASYPLSDAMDVDIRGDYAYVTSADWHGGLYTFDITDPANPVYVSNYYETGFFFWDVEVEDLFAYVTAPSNEYVYLLFLGDPEHPVELDTYTTPGGMFDLFAREGLLFVADGSAGLRILENHLFLAPGGGVAWEVQDSGVTRHLREVHFADDLNGCAVGSYGTIVTTDDGGESWVERTSGTAEDLFAVFFIDGDTGWAGGREGVLLKTTDGGLSWMPQTSGTSAQIWSIDFVSAEVGWAAGGDVYSGVGFVLRTTDGGEHWQLQPTGDAPFLKSVCFVDALHGWVCGKDGVVLRTDDGGADWETLQLPTLSHLSDVCFVDEETGWVCTWDTSIYKTTDGGDGWTQQYSDPGAYSAFQSISFVDVTNGWVVGSLSLGGRSFGTTDGGFSWKEIQGAHEHYLQSVLFVDAEHGWAVGHDGAVLRSVPDLTSVPEGPQEWGTPRDGLLLYAGSPNPFNPATEIGYELPAAAHVTLTIYNTSGQIVRTLVDARRPAGPSSIVWDGRTDAGEPVASGVYLSELRAAGEARRGKLTLLK